MRKQYSDAFIKQALIKVYRTALLIDCDNVSSHIVEGVLAELAKHGTVKVRHAHGNWSSSQLNGWVEKLHPNAIRPLQQFAYTSGKNATDAAMIIDAMDLLYSKNVDGFALMTSDSDFTPLVMRLLECGFPVYGFGAKKTPSAFVHACSQFTYNENFASSSEEKVGNRRVATLELFRLRMIERCYNSSKMRPIGRPSSTDGRI